MLSCLAKCSFLWTNQVTTVFLYLHEYPMKHLHTFQHVVLKNHQAFEAFHHNVQALLVLKNTSVRAQRFSSVVTDTLNLLPAKTGPSTYDQMLGADWCVFPARQDNAAEADL